jgi:[protein-PII] uridylyltransferase
MSDLYSELISIGADRARSRPEIISRLKSFLQEVRSDAEQILQKQGSGNACSRFLSDKMDALIDALYRYAVHPRQEPDMLAIVAVGGYGRGLLAPFSDIDLLFITHPTRQPIATQTIEFLLYVLWDLGLKVGHASRSVDECIEIARVDITVRTAMLESRFILGKSDLFTQMTHRFNSQVVQDTGSQFISEKLLERDVRHAKQGESRYLVEPNVKESKGGLRDLQTLFWIAKYYYRVETSEELVEKGVFSASEFVVFQKAENFLHTIRAHMHFECRKAEERLSFDIQSAIAIRLKYRSHGGLSPVERFMKHYFLVAKNVGDLTRIVCAALEAEHATKVQGLTRFFSQFTKTHKKIAQSTDFKFENERITVANPHVFSNDPVNLIRIFHLVDITGHELHPQALRLITRSLRLIDQSLRDTVDANSLFLQIVSSKKNPELTLRRMNETGVLGRFVPDFGKIVALMQFNMYHHYTVDEHLLRCIGVLTGIENGTFKEDHPLAFELLPSLKNERHLLYIALFLHDIAKGQLEDHSIAGAAIARALCPRFGLSDYETETVAWLVEEHLTMSMVAQSRDLNDRKTISDFADRVQTLERMKLLLILTICDTRAVGPNVWNGWKGQLLRTLYYETELVLTGGFSQVSRVERVEQARFILKAALQDWIEEERTALVALHYQNYLLTVSLDDQVRHAGFIKNATKLKRPLDTMVKTHEFEGVTELTIFAPDHPKLLSIIAGSCANAGAHIVDAQIFTTTHGYALDMILITRAFERDEDEKRRAASIVSMIGDVLSGTKYLPDIVKHKPIANKSLQAFRISPRVEINNELSHKFSVIEVEGLDRIGLLSEITAMISSLNLDIASAHITTFGEKIIDSFYVVDLTGDKITSQTRKNTIIKKLLTLFT